MSLDDFIDDEDGQRPEDLDVQPPGSFDSWREAEPYPDNPDWYGQITANKTTLDNQNFDGEDTVLIAKHIDNNSSYVASDNFQDLDEWE